MNDDQRECLTEAVNFLGPESQAERERYEMEIGRLVGWYHRQDHNPQFKDAREDIDELQKHLERAAKTLNRLPGVAHANLFTPENLERFDGYTGFALSRVLDEIAKACPQAHEDIPKKTGGRSKDHAKADLVVNCLHLFENERPGEAKPNSGDFLEFCDKVYSVASGKKDPYLERAISEAFRQVDRLGS